MASLFATALLRPVHLAAPRDCAAAAKKKSKSKGFSTRDIATVNDAGGSVPASLYLQFGALLGDTNPEQTLSKLVEAGKPLALDAKTVDYLTAQEQRAAEELIVANTARIRAKSDPTLDEADRIAVELDAQRAQEALQATKRLRETLLTELDTVSREQAAPPPSRPVAPTKASLAQQLDSVLSMVRDGKYVADAGAAAPRPPQPPKPTMLPKPAYRGPATQADDDDEIIDEDPSDDDDGVDVVDVEDVEPADLYSQFDTLLSGSGAAAAQPRKLPELQRPGVERRPSGRGAKQPPAAPQPVLAPAPLPSARLIRMTQEGRAVADPFLNERLGEERQASLKRKLAGGRAAVPRLDDVPAAELSPEEMSRFLGGGGERGEPAVASSASSDAKGASQSQSSGGEAAEPDEALLTKPQAAPPRNRGVTSPLPSIFASDGAALIPRANPEASVSGRASSSKRQAKRAADRQPSEQPAPPAAPQAAAVTPQAPAEPKASLDPAILQPPKRGPRPLSPQEAEEARRAAVVKQLLVERPQGTKPPASKEDAAKKGRRAPRSAGAAKNRKAPRAAAAQQRRAPKSSAAAAVSRPKPAVPPLLPPPSPRAAVDGQASVSASKTLRPPKTRQSSAPRSVGVRLRVGTKRTPRKALVTPRKPSRRRIAATSARVEAPPSLPPPPPPPPLLPPPPRAPDSRPTEAPALALRGAYLDTRRGKRGSDSDDAANGDDAAVLADRSAGGDTSSSAAAHATEPREVREKEERYLRAKSVLTAFMDADRPMLMRVITTNAGGAVLCSDEHGFLAFLPLSRMCAYTKLKWPKSDESATGDQVGATEDVEAVQVPTWRPDLGQIDGAVLRVKVVQCNDERRTFVVSERLAYDPEASQQMSYHPAVAERLLASVGSLVTATVAHFGRATAVVSLDSKELRVQDPHDAATVKGRILLSEVSWDPRCSDDVFMPVAQSGQEVVAKIVSVRRIARGALRVWLSVKQAMDDPRLQAPDQLARFVGVASDAVDLDSIAAPVKQYLLRLTSIKDIASVTIEQVADGPEGEFQVWLGKDVAEADAPSAATPPVQHRAAIRYGGRIVVVRLESSLDRVVLRDMLRDVSAGIADEPPTPVAA